MTLFGYLAAVAGLLFLSRWIYVTLRPSEPQTPPSPQNEPQPGMLRTVAQITGSQFPDDEGDDPQSMGEPLALVLYEGLRARHFSAEEPNMSYSHGYEFNVMMDGLAHQVGCGISGDPELPESLVWLVLVTLPSRSSRSHIEPAPNSENGRRLMSALHSILQTLPGLVRVRWTFQDADFDRGKEKWQPQPL